MEDIRIIGSTKLESALDQIVAMLQAHEDAEGKVKINDVAIIVDMVESVPGQEYTRGSLLYSCSDERAWVQSALFEQAALVVRYDPVPAEDEQ